MTSVADADLYLNEVNPKKAIGSNAGIYVEENELKKESSVDLPGPRGELRRCQLCFGDVIVIRY